MIARVLLALLLGAALVLAAGAVYDLVTLPSGEVPAAGSGEP